MQLKQLAMAAAIAATTISAQAQTEIQWWHSMSAALGDWVNDLAKEYNASQDRKSTRLNSSHLVISYAVFCLKKKHIHSTCFEPRCPYNPAPGATPTATVFEAYAPSTVITAHTAAYVPTLLSPHCGIARVSIP